MTDNQKVAGLGCVDAPSLGDTLLKQKVLNTSKSIGITSFLVMPSANLATKLATTQSCDVDTAWRCHGI
jgi:hypothetical protein